jgi:tetratricopeptide (TPR) repeat protein
MLSITEDCQDNDLFLNAVTSMYKLDPSYNSAYYLYRLNASRNNIDEALKYIEEAIAYETSDAATDANYSFEAAAFCFKNGRLAKAYNYANNAVSLDAGMAGKAYFLMGQIWGATSCGGDEIEKRAHYWVAVDFLNKAKAADASLTEDANRAIGSYSIYFPETAEAFMYNVTDGQAYRVVCNGMSASTTVRTRK